MKKQDNFKEAEIIEALDSLVKIRRTLLAKDFLKFRQRYFPHYHKDPDGPFQVGLSKLLFDMTRKRGSKVAIAAPRGSAKSTIVSLEYVIYSICYKFEEFIVIISTTNDQAASFLNNVKQELETNPYLIQDFPEICEIGTRPGPPRWTRQEIVTRNNVKVLALGTGQQIRGRRNREFRPSLIILDDIENDENAQNPESYYKLEEWLTKSVLKAGTTTTNVVCIGTIHHYNSLLAKFTSSDAFPGWEKKIFRSIITWSVHEELWEKWSRIYCHREKHRGITGPQAAREFFETNRKEMLEDTEVLWPAKQSYYDLMVMREEGGYSSFDSEMQNQPVNPKDCYFNPEEIHYWDERFGSEQELLSVLGKDAEFYGACDPSLGKQNRQGDFSAIITVVRDSDKGTIYVLDADISRRLPDKTIEDILTYHKRRNYSLFAFEANQFQEFMASELIKRGNAAGIYVPVEQIKHSSDKFARIQMLQPLIKSGTIQFCKRHRILLEQMKYFPKAAHDDGLDALEMAVKVCCNAVRSGSEILSTDRKFGFSVEYEYDDIGDY